MKTETLYYQNREFDNDHAKDSTRAKTVGGAYVLSPLSITVTAAKHELQIANASVRVCYAAL